MLRPQPGTSQPQHPSLDPFTKAPRPHSSPRGPGHTPLCPRWPAAVHPSAPIPGPALSPAVRPGTHLDSPRAQGIHPGRQTLPRPPSPKACAPDSPPRRVRAGAKSSSSSSRRAARGLDAGAPGLASAMAVLAGLWEQAARLAHTPLSLQPALMPWTEARPRPLPRLPPPPPRPSQAAPLGTDPRGGVWPAPSPQVPGLHMGPGAPAALTCSAYSPHSPPQILLPHPPGGGGDDASYSQALGDPTLLDTPPSLLSLGPLSSSGPEQPAASQQPLLCSEAPAPPTSLVPSQCPHLTKVLPHSAAKAPPCLNPAAPGGSSFSLPLNPIPPLDLHRHTAPPTMALRMRPLAPSTLTPP